MTQAVDRVNFVLTISVMLALAIPLLMFPEASALALQTAYDLKVQKQILLQKLLKVLTLFLPVLEMIMI